MLRTVEGIQGLPRNTLTQAEQKQLKESNILVDRTANAAEAPSRVKKPWGIETHTTEKTDPAYGSCLRSRPQDIRFDQCRV